MLADELTARGQVLMEQSNFVQLSESIKTEFARVTKKIASIEQNHSSKIQSILDELKNISTRLSMVEALESHELTSIKERLEQNVQKIETLTSEDGPLSVIQTSVDKLIARIDQSAQPLRVYTRTHKD